MTFLAVRDALFALVEVDSATLSQQEELTNRSRPAGAGAVRSALKWRTVFIVRIWPVQGDYFESRRESLRQAVTEALRGAGIAAPPWLERVNYTVPRWEPDFALPKPTPKEARMAITPEPFAPCEWTGR